ncbi:ABC transporter ATP-binding protein [Pelagibacterium luteolum]|uniref:Peptide/nickel transport system ATP-binding protein n=1 Tax=Pelagibacterium luteolum TaxID=440168 RepID=A0A1G7W051_9HYPH|nr:ABC transporter ATP-binding protein [Pelagibacterium luteolum]SDG65395.1 peptide/nickel transport system ATP-binding protein [Pelagibacterium luteolum]
MSLVTVEGVTLSIGDTPVLNGVSLEIAPGEVLGLVGESGSGKSMTALSVLKLLPVGARVAGQIAFDGRDIIAASEREMVALRGDEIGMIFQEPMTALNPLMTIGDQVAETARIHTRVGRSEARALAKAMLERVGLPHDRIAHTRYPHELSGGQRQRVGIAMAVVLRPKLLIADEPTTALDVTTQAQILDLLRGLVRDEGMALMLITHDLAVVAGMADSIAVMDKGVVVERGTVLEVLQAPRNAYTKKLIAASTHVPVRQRGKQGGALLEVEGLCKDYALPRTSLFGPHETMRAVDHVSFTIKAGESVGLVGESGSGKSTLARAILGLETVTAGHVLLKGQAVHAAGRAAFATLRDMQMVFQDPYGSFDPRQKVGRLVAEPLHLLGSGAPKGAALEGRVDSALKAVGIEPGMADRYIHEFSGGQRQRIAIARALIIEPALIVLDEAVSAIDVSVRAQILDLLADLGDRLGHAYLFISHDLGVVRAITDRVLVMAGGKIVEAGPTADVLERPAHAYTKTLVAAAPRLAG